MRQPFCRRRAVVQHSNARELRPARFRNQEDLRNKEGGGESSSQTTVDLTSWLRYFEIGLVNSFSSRLESAGGGIVLGCRLRGEAENQVWRELRKFKLKKTYDRSRTAKRRKIYRGARCRGIVEKRNGEVCATEFGNGGTGISCRDELRHTWLIWFGS